MITMKNFYTTYISTKINSPYQLITQADLNLMLKGDFLVWTTW